MPSPLLHRGLAGLLLLGLATPGPAPALTLPTLRDLADPVPPGGVLTYRVTLSNEGTGAAVPFCFNPPPECISLGATCSNPPPSCVGDESSGFVCQNAENEGANCGVGTPPTADPSLCTQRSEGVCSGGSNNGLPCDAPNGAFTTDCPGYNFRCVRSFNEGDYCGSDTPPPPHPVPEFCLANPTGICSGGPNFAQPCTAPHGTVTAECPADSPPPTTTDITVVLPILTGLSFIDADNGGTSDGTQITWTVPPLAPCGVPGTPKCPTLEARFLVDPLVPEGTVFQNQATATDQDGFLVSGKHRTTVARFRLRGLTLSYPPTANRDRIVYRCLFTLLATETIDPPAEPFGLRISDANGTIADLTLPAGALVQTSAKVVRFRGTTGGFRRVTLRNVSPGHYAVRALAVGLELPDIDLLDVTVELTLGDDVLGHPVRLEERRTGRRYVAQRSTSTTTIVSPPTTTTSTTLP